jgi:hypothetical protein
MPAPTTQSKYKEQFENNIYLRNKMRLDFQQAQNALSNGSLGPLGDFEVFIDNVKLRYRTGDEITIDDTSYESCSPDLRKQGYDRLEKFMKIAIDRYNTQYNL